MLRFGHVSVGEGAGLGCARCSMPHAPTYRSVAEVAEDVARLAADWDELPGPNVVLDGPEPFAHPGLPALVAAAVGAGFQRICIETDGGALSLPENVEGVLRSGVRLLRVRVLASDDALSAELSAKPRLIDATRRGVAAYLAAAESALLSVAVTVVVPVCGHNIEALPATVADIASWGVQGLRLVAAGALPPGAEAVVAAACDTGMVNRLWVETDGRLPLPASHALHAASDGDTDE